MRYITINKDGNDYVFYGSTNSGKQVRIDLDSSLVETIKTLEEKIDEQEDKDLLEEINKNKKLESEKQILNDKIVRKDREKQELEENFKKQIQELILYTNMTQDEISALVADVEEWEVGEVLKQGDRRKRGDIAYQVIQQHTSQVGWEPENVPSLWRVYVPPKKDNKPVIVDFKKPTGAHDAYQTGDLVLFMGRVYKCKLPNTVHNPLEYAQAWEIYNEVM